MAEEAFTREDAAARAGVPIDRLDELITAGIIKPRPNEQYTVGDIRRIRMVEIGRPVDSLISA